MASALGRFHCNRLVVRPNILKSTVASIILRNTNYARYAIYVKIIFLRVS